LWSYWHWIDQANMHTQCYRWNAHSVQYRTTMHFDTQQA
jgi:hypothetical protein